MAGEPNIADLYDDKEEYARFAREPAAYIAEQMSKFKLEQGEMAAAAEREKGGYLAGEEDGVSVRDFGVEKRGCGEKE